MDFAGKPHQVIIKSLFKVFGIYPAKTKKYEQLIADRESLLKLKFRLELLKKLPESKIAFFAKHFEHSASQFYQDLFIASELGGKKDGFFVEIGACDGLRLSNSLFFERHLGWRGILAEPGKAWHPALKINRLAKIDFRAVWRTSGCKMLFNETKSREVSTLDMFNTADFHSELRFRGKQYLVETISLEDLLKVHSAPDVIDYLSIDTEGSEFDILSNFDFSRRLVRCITCEHNYTHNREKIHALLSSKGYNRKYCDFSECDDWYFFD